jgi:hypothetical protein
MPSVTCRGCSRTRVRHAPALGVCVLLMAVAVVASVGAPWPLALLIDSALGDEPAPPWLLALNLDSTPRLILAAVVAGFLLVLTSSGSRCWRTTSTPASARR